MSKTNNSKKFLPKIGGNINKILAEIRVIRHDLDNDYRAIHGNSSPGLIAQMTDMQIKINSLENQVKTILESKKNRVTLIGTIIANAIALLSIIINFMTKTPSN